VIRRQVVMPVSPERLWEALTDPEQVTEWFGARVDWALEEGGPARFLDDDGSVRAGRIEAVRPGQHLRFLWWPTGNNDDGPADVSEVSYLLEPVAEGTRLTIQERQIGTSPDRAACGPAQACAAGSPRRWTSWDGRLAGAWAGLVATPAFAEAVRN
jgi:uncharacterized protein YndB with AHSA1/START domain